MSLSTLGLFLVVVFITCVTPGAGVLYTLHNAVNYGVKNAFMSPTGNAIGVAVMSVIAASGMGAVINNSPVLFYGLPGVSSWLGLAGRAGRLQPLLSKIVSGHHWIRQNKRQETGTSLPAPRFCR